MWWFASVTRELGRLKKEGGVPGQPELYSKTLVKTNKLKRAWKDDSELRSYTALAKDPSSFPSTFVGWLTVSYNSSSGMGDPSPLTSTGSDYTYITTERPTHIYIINNNQNESLEPQSKATKSSYLSK